MSMELMHPARPQCRLKIGRVSGAYGAFNLVEVEHTARHFAPHFFTSYAFGVVQSGRCCVMTPRGSWIAGPGSIMAFSPYELHWAQVLSEEPYGYRMAYLSSECMHALWREEVGAGRDGPRDLVPLTASSPLSSAFLNAHREVSDDPAGAHAAARLLSCTRAMMSAAVGPPQRPGTAKELTLVETAKEFLTTHIGRKVCLSSVADTCGVTAFHLIRVFRRITGISPYSYLIVLRVNEARRMLDAGAAVSDAVYACRFSDQSHLTRVFKRTLGLPPGLYLRSTR
jgi:AraC-like DNA-binding protein